MYCYYDIIFDPWYPIPLFNIHNIYIGKLNLSYIISNKISAVNKGIIDPNFIDVTI